MVRLNEDGTTRNAGVSSPIVVDVLVIGGGMAGTASAYYLSQSPNLTIALLERCYIGHDQCSSYGEERMYRRMYSNTYLSDLQEKSLLMKVERGFLNLCLHTKILKDSIGVGALGVIFTGQNC